MNTNLSITNILLNIKTSLLFIVEDKMNAVLQNNHR